jgi:hypothetical protein
MHMRRLASRQVFKAERTERAGVNEEIANDFLINTRLPPRIGVVRGFRY